MSTIDHDELRRGCGSAMCGESECLDCYPLPSSSEKSVLGIQHGGDHYKLKGIQPAVYINANNLNFFEGNVVKYVTRWRDKGGIEDLKKAHHYLEMLMEFEGEK